MPTINNLIAGAQAGDLSLTATPETFIRLELVLRQRKDDIRQIQANLLNVARETHWGIGESSPVLTSAQTMVNTFRQKAEGGPNNAIDVLDQHSVAAEQWIVLFRTIRQRLEAADAEFAAAIRRLAVEKGLDLEGAK